ncbi:MAG: MmgE/PrpD family protein [Acidimicrobiia bacterium]
MDKPTRAIVDYATQLSFDSLSPAQVASTVRHVVDTVACGLGGYTSEPARGARRLAATGSSSMGASVLGMPGLSTPEYAAFANAVMVRYLDYNDTGPAGHASDQTPGVLAVAEPIHSSGRDVVRSVFAMYEVVASLARNGAHFFDLRMAGVDQVWSSVGAAVGAGMVLGLTPEQLANAISLALVPNVPLRVTRTGVISDWKGCATAHGVMSGVFAARLAKEGITGPSEPFDGVDGFRRLTGLGPDAMDDIGQPIDGRSTMEATAFKCFPSEYTSQGLLATILKMTDGVAVAEIDSIDIGMHHVGWHEIGGGAGDRDQKWNPSTRETADHSLPYLVAAAITDRNITVATFDLDRVRDPALRPVMNKIEVHHDPELTRQLDDGGLWTSEWPTTIAIRLLDGTVLQDRSTYPRGGPNNPMTDDELELKFRSMSDVVMPAEQASRLLDVLWRFDQLADVNELTAHFRAFGEGEHG